MWIILFGITLPLFLGPFTSPKVLEEAPSWKQEIHPALIQSSLWVWFGLILFLFFSRFFLIGSSFWWPDGDESLNAFYLPFWLQHWHWTLFVAVSQIPSTLSYLSFIIFKLTGNPLLSVQMVSAIISCLTVFVGYQICRIYFSKSTALILFLLLSFSYWPLLISWTFLPGITTPLWECVLLYLLSRINKSSGDSKYSWFFLLGLSLGMGPYTFFSWPVLFLWILCAVFSLQQSRPSFKGVAVLCAGITVTLTPFLWSIYHEPYGNYFWEVAGKGQAIPWISRLKVTATYLSSLFGSAGNATWSPRAGGYLNVLLSSCFFIGLIELIRFRKTLFFKAYVSAFILFMLPGLLSRDFEGHRILFVMPVVLWTVASGIQVLLLKISKSQRLYFLCLLLSLSFALDFQRLDNPIANFMRSESMPNERRFSYEILKPIADHSGPGLIFTEFIPNTTDYSLSCFSYSFNTAFNQKLSLENVKWAAIFTEDYYESNLRKAFPQLKSIKLPENKHHILVILPLTNSNREILINWVSFYRLEMNLNYQLVGNPSGRSRDFILRQFINIYPSLPKDAFIQSCFFQKLLYVYSAEKTFNLEDSWCNFHNFSEVFYDSYRHSYQNSILCAQFSQLLILEHQESEARKLLENFKRVHFTH